MLTRKTQYAWMAVGGMLCLFGLLLACKLRDGHKAIAQGSKPTIPLAEEVMPLLPDPLPQKKEMPAADPRDELPRFEPEKAFQTRPSPKDMPEPKPALEVPLAPFKPIPAEFKWTDQKPMDVPSPDAPPSPPVSESVSPASFNPNSPTPPKEAPKGIGPIEKTSSPAVGESAQSKPKDPPSPVPPTPSGVDPLLKAPPPPLVEKPNPTWNRPVSAPADYVAPVGFAPASPAAPSAPPRPDHEANKPQPGEPPLAPAPGPVQIYRVRDSETLQDIARHTLGSAERWTDIQKLNPTLKTEGPLSAGTTVRLPGDACVPPPDDSEPVKPLPALRPKPVPPKAKVLPLTGTFQCSLDEKNRMTLPRAIRDQLSGSATVLVSPGPDKCLWLTNPPHLERLGERLEQSQAHEADVRVFKRLYFAQTEKLAVTADGRVTIPDRLAQFAKLHQELVLVGIDDHFEVWDAARWRQYTQQKSASVSRSPTATEQE